MTAKEMIGRLRTGIKGTAFELRGAYGNYELWANDTRLEAGSIKDVYNAWIKYRFNPKYQMESVEKLVESGISKILKKVLTEGKFGAFDVNDAREFGTKYQKFITDTMRANPKFGKYVGYTLSSKELTIIGENGMITFDAGNMKPIKSQLIFH